jgi:serine/threonine protein kinase
MPAFMLLDRMLAINPRLRPTAAECLQDPYLAAPCKFEPLCLLRDQGAVKKGKDGCMAFISFSLVARKIYSCHPYPYVCP